MDTMDEFRAQIRQQLHDNKHAAALNRAKDAILTQLAAAAEGELPSVLVESAYQQEMEQIQQQLQMQRLSLDRYLSQIHETRESFTAKVRSSAEKTARVHMALLQIAQQENLVRTDEEIDKMIAERAERTKKTVEEIREKNGFETNAIVTMEEVVEHLYNRTCQGRVVIDDTIKAAIDDYYKQYGCN